MHNIYFYKDKEGKCPVADYLVELAGWKDEDSCEKLNKIRDHVKALSQYGTRLGKPYIRHFDGCIWVFRPIRDRVFFVGRTNIGLVLLHDFMKLNLDIPTCEFERAERELGELEEISAIGCTLDELEQELFTPEEIAASDLRVSLIGEFIKARQENRLNQGELKEPVIERIENLHLGTVLKFLASLGKTLAIVPIEPK